jgi:L-gulonolactone oxidase
MGAHRSSIREDSMVAAGVLSLDIINGNGDIVTIERNETNDDWLAASTSLGLLGVIARMKFKIYPDFKVYAKQDIYDEDDILDADIHGMIAPYATANFWVRIQELSARNEADLFSSGGRTSRSSTIDTMMRFPQP